MSLRFALLQVLCVLMFAGCSIHERSCARTDPSCRYLLPSLLYELESRGEPLFVAVGSDGGSPVAYVSRAGLDWTPVETRATNTPVVVMAGEDRLVAAGSGASYIWSNDGMRWTQGALPIGAAVSGSHGASRFVVVNSGADEAAWSEDGLNWNATDTAGAGDENRDLAYSNGAFVGAGVIGEERRSIDGGDSWSGLKTPGKGGDSDAVAADGNRFVQLSVANPGEVCVSTDLGANFSCTRGAGIPTNVKAVEHNQSVFIAVGYGGSAYASVDGTPGSWSSDTGPGMEHLNALASGDGRVVAAGDSGAIYYSEDGGATWSGNVGPGGSIIFEDIAFATL